MLKQYTLEQLVEEVNRSIAENKSNVQPADGRLSDTVTVRKVRDLLAKRLINPPVKEGRQNYFDDGHVNQILNIKTLQKEGASEKLLKGLSSSTYYGTPEQDSNDESEGDSTLKAGAMNILNSIAARSMGAQSPNLESAAGCIMPQLNSSPAIKRSKIEDVILGASAGVETNSLLSKASMSYIDSHKTSVKVFGEYPLDDSGKLFLKMEQGYTVSNKEEMLEKIKQILGLGE